MDASRESIDDVVLRWPTAAARRWLRVFIEEASRDDNVLAVVAVGSSIRPGVQSDDLDLVVLCRNRKKLAYKVPIEVDLRAFVEATLDDEVSGGHDLLCWAVKFGIPVFDRGTWERLRLRWSDRLPFPDPEKVRARAARAAGHLAALEEIGDTVAAAEMRVSELTLRARAALAEAKIYPASRPELATQLRSIGESRLAQDLAAALLNRRIEAGATPLFKSPAQASKP